MFKHKGLPILGLLLSLFIINTADADTPWSLTQASLGKQFSATLNCDKAPFVGGFQTCSLSLSHKTDSKETPTESIKNAKIVLGGGMPAHHHGLPTKPVVIWSNKSHAYQIQGLKFSMPGAWELHFYIDALDKLKTEKDTVTFKLAI